MKKLLFFLLIFTTTIFISNSLYLDRGYAEGDRSAEIEEFITMLKSNNMEQRINASKRITRSGLTDPKLFDLIRDNLVNGYQSDPNNPKHIDEIAWLCKALASSGRPEYKEALKKVADTTGDAKLERYARQGMDLIDEFAKRNKIISDTKNTVPGQSPEVTRLINMLKSDNLALKRDAAKEIYRSHFTDQNLFGVVNEELLKGYQISPYDRHHVDVMAWLCKALGASGMPEYKATLSKIVETSSSEALRKHAKLSLDMIK